MLKEEGIVHDIFHGGLKQDERERALLKFRNGSHYILLCTDLAARGLDIPEIQNVVHYQIPKDEETFVLDAKMILEDYYLGKLVCTALLQMITTKINSYQSKMIFVFMQSIGMKS